MKKSLLIALLAALCLTVASCTGEDAGKGTEGTQHSHMNGDMDIHGIDADDTTSADADYVEELSDKAIEIMKKVPDYPEGYPTLQDAANLYKKANMAVGWIISTESVAVYDDVSINVDGLEYKRVRPDCYYGAHNLANHADKLGKTGKLIFDLDSLEAYLKTLINPEEAELYMDDAEDLKKFVEDEAGNLYVLPFSYTPEGFGEEKYTLDDNGDGTYTFNVAYTLVDDNGNPYKEKTESFNLIKVDGRWVFEDFRVIKQN